MRNLIVIGVVIVLGACSPQGTVETDFDLKIMISELCTTCNDVLRCEQSADRPAGELPPIVVYNLLEDSVWAQIATIWEYLIQNIRPKIQDERAMTIYAVEAADSGSAQVITDQQAIVDAVNRRVLVPGAYVDQRDGRWYQLDAADQASPIGQCELLGFQAGRELLASLRTAIQEEQ